MLKETVVRHYGTQQKVADALGCRQSVISSWGAIVPFSRAYVLNRLNPRRLKIDLSLYPECRVLIERGRQ